MTESLTHHSSADAPTLAQTQQSKMVLPETPASVPTTLIIWTPRFMVIFALTLIIGLCTENLLAESWFNGLVVGEKVLLVHAALLFCIWVAVVIFARSEWVRIGGLFGCSWAIFTAMDLVVNLLPITPHEKLVISTHLNAATNSALLGAYICLSISRTPFLRWDSWFFKLTPIVGICAVIATYFLISHEHSIRILESMTAIVALFFCVFVWWLRPSCWRSQPGPTFLFGIGPLILLWLAMPNLKLAGTDTNFFYSQVVLLCTLLGALRILQGELRYAHVYTLQTSNDIAEKTIEPAQER